MEWPSSSLRLLTLIDTPGIAALSGAPSARTADFLTPGEGRETAADAVLYLMKHLHATDVDFLAAFHDEEVSQATPVNAIAVLSRADEVGGGRLDSLESAAKIARRYADDEKVRRLAQTVLPVAGLLGETGETLREAEFQAIATLAKATPEDVDRILVSVDRFANADAHVGLTTMERQALLERLGLFGVRLAIALVRDGTATNSNALAEALVDRSGLPELRTVLLSQFAERRDLLKARSGLLAVETLAHAKPVHGSEDLLAMAEQVGEARTSSPSCACSRCCAPVRSRRSPTISRSWSDWRAAKARRSRRVSVWSRTRRILRSAPRQPSSWRAGRSAPRARWRAGRLPTRRASSCARARRSCRRARPPDEELLVLLDLLLVDRLPVERGWPACSARRPTVPGSGHRRAGTRS